VDDFTSDDDRYAPYLRRPDSKPWYLQSPPVDTGIPKRSLGSRIWEGVSQPADLAFRAGSRMMGLPVGEDATLGSGVRAGLGLSQGDEGYAGHLAGRAIEEGTEFATSPLTYAPFGALPKAARVAAGAGFVGSAALGAYQQGKKAISDISQQGLTPESAEEALGAGISAEFARRIGKHTAGEFDYIKNKFPSAYPQMQGPVIPPKEQPSVEKAAAERVPIPAPGPEISSDMPRVEPHATPEEIEAEMLSHYSASYESLDDREKGVADRWRKQVATNLPDLIDQYIKKNTRPDGSVLVGSDDAKDLNPEYQDKDERSINSMAVQGPATYLAKQVYREMLKRDPPPGLDRSVTISAGGSGSGKTTGVAAATSGMANKSYIVFDTQSAFSQAAKDNANMAIANGRDVRFLYTKRDPYNAYMDGVIPRAEQQGRVVTIGGHVAAHINSVKVFSHLMDYYKDDPNVYFAAVDNNGTPEQAHQIDPEDIRKVKYDGDKLTRKIAAAVQDRFNNGSLSKPIYIGTKLDPRWIGGGEGVPATVPPGVPARDTSGQAAGRPEPGVGDAQPGAGHPPGDTAEPAPGVQVPQGRVAGPRIRGSADVPLDEAGQAAANEQGNAWHATGDAFDELYSGTLGRHTSSAEPLPHKGNVIPVKEAIPWESGVSGTPEKEALPYMHDLIKHPDKVPDRTSPVQTTLPPETFNAYKKRMLDFWYGLEDRLKANPSLKLGLVTSTRGQMLIRSDVAQGPERYAIDDKTMLSKGPPPGTVDRIWFDDKGERHIDKDVKPKPGEPIKPGLYSIRHGETAWNEKPSEAKAEPPSGGSAVPEPVAAAPTKYAVAEREKPVGPAGEFPGRPWPPPRPQAEPVKEQFVSGETGKPPQEAPTSSRFAVAPKPKEPGPLGFYSQLDRAASAVPQAMSGKDMLRYLSDPKRGVKSDEMKWTGLDDFLKERGDKKVTPQELQQFVRQNQVEIHEVTKEAGGPHKFGTPEEQRAAHDRLHAAGRAMGAANPGDPNWEQVSEEWADANAAMRDTVPGWGRAPGSSSGTAKFTNKDWQLPGGKNYREVLLTMPPKTEKVTAKIENWGTEGSPNWTVVNQDGDSLGQHGPQKDQAETHLNIVNRGDYERAEKGTFTGGHFEEPNVLAHLRLNDRTDADGKKTLFVEEVQSDWAQKGRKEGFSAQPTEAEIDAARSRLGRAVNAYEQRDRHLRYEEGDAPDKRWRDTELTRLGNERVEAENALNALERPKGQPPGPFVGKTEDWTSLAMKRVLRMAAEGGYDRVAWTRGDQQNDRYDLSKHIDRLMYGSDGKLTGWKNGEPVLTKMEVDPTDLPDHVGKEVAEKMMQSPEKRDSLGHPYRELSGLDLKVGGEGMKGFYDQILPGVMNKLGKKWGVRAGQTTLPGSSGLRAEESDGMWSVVTPDGVPVEIDYSSRAEAEAAIPKLAKASGPGEDVHSIDITPEMRQSVMKEGQAQFAVAPKELESDFKLDPSGNFLHSPDHIKRHIETVASKLQGNIDNPKVMGNFVERIATVHYDDITKAVDSVKTAERAAVKVHPGDEAAGVPTLWALGWEPGQGTDIHDHKDSRAAVHVMRGAVGETVFEAPPGYVEAAKEPGGVELREGTHVLTKGGVQYVKAPYVHVISGALPGRSITLHAYYPPLEAMNYFRRENGRLVWDGEWDASKPPEIADAEKPRRAVEPAFQSDANKPLTDFATQMASKYGDNWDQRLTTGEQTQYDQLRHGTSKPITIDVAQKNFPGLDFEAAPHGNAFIAPLKDGGVVRVSTDGMIDVPSRSWAESAKARGLAPEAAVPVGSYTRVGPDSVAWVAKQKPEPFETADDVAKRAKHEAFHFFFDRALSDKEKAQVLNKYGDEEKAAYAYQDWTPKEVNSWFQKILAYAKRLYTSFRPTWESAFERIRSGEAGAQIAGEKGGLPQQVAMEAAPGEGAPLLKSLGVDWSKLSPDQQKNITKDVAGSVIDRAAKLSGVTVNPQEGVGGWGSATAPNVLAEVRGSPKNVSLFSRLAGLGLQQTEVWSTRVTTDAPNRRALDLWVKGTGLDLSDDAQAEKLWKDVIAKDPTVGDQLGFSRSIAYDDQGRPQPAIRIILPEDGPFKNSGQYADHIGGLIDKAFGGKLNVVADDIPVRLDIARHDWTQEPTGATYQKEALAQRPSLKGDLPGFLSSSADAFRDAVAKHAPEATPPGQAGIPEATEAPAPGRIARALSAGVDYPATGAEGEPALAGKYAVAAKKPEELPGSTEGRLRAAALGEVAGGGVGRIRAKPGGGGALEGPLNLDRLNTPDSVKQAFDRAVTAILPEIRRSKGTRTLDEIKQEADDILGKGWFNEKTLAKRQREDRALNSAEVVAAKELNHAAENNVVEKAKAYLDALKAGGDTGTEDEALEAAITQQHGLLLSALGRQAESARALGAYRVLSEGLSPEARMVRKLAQENGGTLSQAQLKEIALAAASGDRNRLKEAYRKNLAPTWWDKFYEVYLNGLISGPKSVLSKTASDTVMQAGGLVKRVLSAGIEQVRSAITGQAPQRSVDDAYADLRGMKRAFSEMFDPESPFSATRGFNEGVTLGDYGPLSERESVRKGIGAISGTKGEIVRTPGKLFEGVTNVAQGMSFYREAYVQAGRKARGEAKARGLSDVETEQYVNDRREDIVNQIASSLNGSMKAGKKYAGPFGDIYATAEKQALYESFQTKAGPTLQAAINLREQDPSGILKIVAPFMRTPANIFKVAVEHTPLKLIDVISKTNKIRRLEAAGEPIPAELQKYVGGNLSDELAKPLLGTLLALPIIYMAKEGLVTGSGPSDPKERELWRATGAQPDSVVIPIDGKNNYVSYHRLEPIASIMSLAADFVEAADSKARGQLADKTVGAIVNQIHDKTFLTGLSDVALAYHEPKRYLSTLVKDTAGNLVPFSGLMHATAAATDPTVRDRSSVLDAVVAGLPGLSRTLPPKPTGTGTPIEREPVAGAVSALTPFAMSQERPGTELERTMLDLDYHRSAPERILTIPGAHGRKVPLTQGEFEMFQEADRKASDYLRQAVVSPEFKGKPPEEQKAEIERVYSRAQRMVRERLYTDPGFAARANDALAKAKAERNQPASFL
jgi:broad specificity phosphatase PhoE